MVGMAKKKPKQTQGSTDMPAAAAETDRQRGSRHKPRKMVSLSPRLYDLLKQLARRNKRPLVWEARIAICHALLVAKIISEEEAERMTQDEDEEPD